MFRLSLRELFLLVTLMALAIPSLTYASNTWLTILVAVTMIVFFAALIGAVVDRGPRQAFAIGLALTMLAYRLILTTGRTSAPAPNGGTMTKNIEMGPWEGRLPTTRQLTYVHAAVQRGEWVVSPPILQNGAVGEWVEVLQHMLNARTVPSPNIATDADFGLATEGAVKQFQAQAGLAQTGIVDDKTWKALGPIIDPTTGKLISAYVPKLPLIASGSNLPGYIWFRENPPREIFMAIGHFWWALILGYAGGHFARFVYWRRIREGRKRPADIS